MTKYDFYNKELNLVIAKSDEFIIRKVGTDEEYTEAIDLFDHYDEVDNTPRGEFRYEETDKPLPKYEPLIEEVKV